MMQSMFVYSYLAIFIGIFNYNWIERKCEKQSIRKKEEKEPAGNLLMSIESRKDQQGSEGGG